MHLLTHLTPSVVPAVRRAVRHARIRNIGGYQEFAHAIRSTSVDAMVVDPELIGTGDARWITLLGCHTSLPLALYAGVSPGSVRAMVSLAHVRAPYLIVRDFESESTRLARFIRDLPPISLDRQVLSTIAEPLALLPRELAIAVELLFARPDQAHTVDWLASSSARSRRWVEQKLTHAGFMSAARLVRSPWLVRAYHYLRDDAFAQRDVASKVGVASPHTMFQELGRLGLHSRQDIERISSTDLVNRVVHTIYSREHAK